MDRRQFWDLLLLTLPGPDLTVSIRHIGSGESMAPLFREDRLPPGKYRKREENNTKIFYRNDLQIFSIFLQFCRQFA